MSLFFCSALAQSCRSGAGHWFSGKQGNKEKESVFVRTVQARVRAAVVLVKTGPVRLFSLSISIVTDELALFVRRRRGVTSSMKRIVPQSVPEACICVLLCFFLSSLLCNEC